MNKRLLMTVLVITGICFVHETQPMAARFLSRLKAAKTRFTRRPTIKRSYAKTIKTATKKPLSQSQKVALVGGSAVAGYTIWNLWGLFGEKTTLSEPLNFIPTPDQIARRYEKMDENPELQMLSNLGFTKISQVVTTIQKQLNRKLSPQEKENTEKLIGYMVHSNPESYLHGTAVVNSLELLPLLLYVHSKAGKNFYGREDLLPADKEYSPFIYNGLKNSPITRVFEKQSTGTEYQKVTEYQKLNEISKKICNFAGIKDTFQFNIDFINLINSSEKYEILKRQSDLLIIQDYLMAPRKHNEPDYNHATRYFSGDHQEAQLFSFANTHMNKDWGKIYFGRDITVSGQKTPAYKFFQDKKMEIKQQKSGYFSTPEPRTFQVLQAPVLETSIYTLYKEEFGTDLNKLIEKHGGKIE